MPKAPSSSRWFLFTVDDPEHLLSQIQKCGCSCSQWFITDKVVTGYLFFPTTRSIPKKKSWIYTANIMFTDREELLSKYKTIPIDNWINYGSDFLFNLNCCRSLPKVVKPPVKEDSDSEDDNPPFSFIFKKVALHPQAVRIARDFTDKDFVEEVMDSLEYIDKLIVSDHIALIATDFDLFKMAYDHYAKKAKKICYKCPYETNKNKLS